MSDESLTRIAALPCWRGSIDPQPLRGGITNKNYLVVDCGEKFVARLGHDIAEHGVMRFNELAASRAAHAAGISPEVIYAEPGVLVLRFIEGVTFDAAAVHQPRNLERIIALIKRAHDEIPHHLSGPTLTFWVFNIIRMYAEHLRSHAHVRAGAHLSELMRAAQALEREAGPRSVVFGHNDLLAANFIDDGQRIWLIDWEYAGYNSPLFDLGGLISNNELSAAQERYVLEAYFGGLNAQVARRLATMKCASLLRETMWSMVSELHSRIEFDYAAYTDENLRRFRAAYQLFSHSHNATG